jgi:hypothetical protein
MNKYTDTIYFEGNQLIYKGIKMNITPENIILRLWTGNDVMEMLESIYLSNIVEVRDSKIDTILDNVYI